MILLDRITKTYPGDEEPTLDNVSLHIEPHEFVFLIGESGAGKSTLIKMITKEEQPDSGKIIIGGIDLDYVKKRHIPHYRRRLGVVFQDYKLLPTRTVFENVAFALEIAGMSGKEIAHTVPKVLDLVGLSNKMHKFPPQLSGGERQRVSIARSVARQPKILIADEPTGNLDPRTCHEIIDLLQKIHDFGTTIMVTTHDMNIVNNLGKRVITLKAGRIVDDQKNNGIYRLDSEEAIRERRFMQPVAAPIPQPVQHIIAPTNAIFAQELTAATTFDIDDDELDELDGIFSDGSSLKIRHDNHRKNTKNTKATKAENRTGAKATRTTKIGKTGAKSSPVAKTAPKAGGKSATPVTTQTATRATPTKTPAATVSAIEQSLAHGSANQWYTASRPLKAAPKLSDFSPGQTVKLKPAPSMRQALKQPIITNHKQKHVI